MNFKEDGMETKRMILIPQYSGDASYGERLFDGGTMTIPARSLVYARRLDDRLAHASSILPAHVPDAWDMELKTNALNRALERKEDR
jgi:hypothetical protein